MANKNILNIIKESNNNFADDYIIQDGIILDRSFLIENGVIENTIKYSKKYYPIYIPGKHPTKGKGTSRITLNDIYSKDSILYTNSNYFDIATLKDTSQNPKTGYRVRVYYSKSANKIYSAIYFEIVDEKSILSKQSGDITIFSENLDSSFEGVGQSVASYSGGNTKRGIRISFNDMFSQTVGKIILLRNDNMALNIFSAAGQESSWYSGAVGDSGKSYGWFQMNTGVHTPDVISQYIDAGLNYFKIRDLPTTKVSKLSLSYNLSEWQRSVGYEMEYPVKRVGELNADIQLLVWVGYMVTKNYVNRLGETTIFDDIVNYQKAQRFVESLSGSYVYNTKNYFYKNKPNRDNRYAEIKKFQESVFNNVNLTLYDYDHKYLAEYIKSTA